MKLVALFLILATAALGRRQAELPGVKLAANEKFGAYLVTAVLPTLEKMLLTVPIPSISGRTSTPVGDIDYVLSNIAIKSISIQDAAILLQPPRDIDLLFSGMDVALTLDWHYREVAFPHVSDSGTADVSAAKSTGAGDVAVTAINSRLNVTVVNFAVSIADLSIDPHGGASWIYSLFIAVFKSQIITALQNAIDTQLPPALNSIVYDVLSTLPVEVQVFSGVTLDYAIDDPPVVPQTGLLTVGMQGEFYAQRNHTESPETPVALPDSVSTQHMVQAFISEYTLDSMGFAFFNAGELGMGLTAASVSDDYKQYFTTSFLGQLVPELQAAYPDSEVMFDLVATDSPAVVLSAKDPELTATVVGNIAVFAHNKTSGVFQNAFTLSAKALLEGDVQVSGVAANVTAKLMLVDIHIALARSNIGPVDISTLSDVITFLQAAALDQMNEVLARGFPLPTFEGVSLVDPQVSYGEDYLVVLSDVKIVLPI